MHGGGAGRQGDTRTRGHGEGGGIDPAALSACRLVALWPCRQPSWRPSAAGAGSTSAARGGLLRRPAFVDERGEGDGLLPAAGGPVDVDGELADVRLRPARRFGGPGVVEGVVAVGGVEL